jgi:hypothetical protein
MKNSDKNRAILAEVIARSWRERDYRAKFRQNPRAVLEQAGATIPAGMDVVLLENTPTVINAILPPIGDMAKYADKIQASVKLLNDMPDDVEVIVRRDSASRTFIVIPTVPFSTGDLTDTQLEQVVGGKGSPFSDLVGVFSKISAPDVSVSTSNTAVQTTYTVSTAVLGAEIAVAAVVVPCFIS